MQMPLPHEQSLLFQRGVADHSQSPQSSYCLTVAYPSAPEVSAPGFLDRCSRVAQTLGAIRNAVSKFSSEMVSNGLASFFPLHRGLQLGDNFRAWLTQIFGTSPFSKVYQISLRRHTFTFQERKNMVLFGKEKLPALLLGLCNVRNKCFQIKLNDRNVQIQGKNLNFLPFLSHASAVGGAAWRASSCSALCLCGGQCWHRKITGAEISE